MQESERQSYQETIDWLAQRAYDLNLECNRTHDAWAAHCEAVNAGKVEYDPAYLEAWNAAIHVSVETDRVLEGLRAIVAEPETEPEPEPEPEPEYPDETDDSDITGEPAWNVSARQLQENYRNGMPAFPFSGDATTIEKAGL